MFKNNKTRTDFKGEINLGETHIDTLGLISNKERIENLIMAGKRLEASRGENYDFPDGEFKGHHVPPMRRPNFDMADATQLEWETKQRIQQQREEQLRAAEALQAAEGSPLTGETDAK